MMGGTAAPVILLVEDNLGDVELTRDGLEATGILHELVVARDGAEAMAFLSARPGPGDTPRPSLVLLDLNLPKKDGREVLAAIKGDPELRRIPVLVYTSSDAEEDVRICYNLHANAFITKPALGRDIAETLRQTAEFWLRRVRRAS